MRPQGASVFLCPAFRLRAMPGIFYTRDNLAGTQTQIALI
jgi:hypothetical protein